MKIWHDDVRPIPDNTWTLARTNGEARRFLLGNKVSEISLDHDLGADPADGIMARGTGEETGHDLVLWMCKYGFIPPKITIHSWNHSGAERMAAALNDYLNSELCDIKECEVIVEPFRLV